MKTFLTYSILLTGLFLSACTSEDVLPSSNEVKEVKATLNPFQDGESVTRTEYSISEQTGFQTLWATGDILGIYPIGGDQVSFPISDGVGTTSAKFDGGSWALRGNYKYAAYYPYDIYNTFKSETEIPVDFTGQTQNGNNTTAHLAAVDFMAAAGTQPSSNGSVNLSFNHVGCFLRMQFTMPVADTFTSVEIQTDGGTFTTKGTVNLAATTPSLSPTATTTKLTLGLTNVSTTSANQSITLYMMVAPGNLSNQTLTFTVKDSNGNSYTKTAAGKNMLATYAYNYALTLEATGTGGNTGGGSWGTNTHNGHEYVDLGLSSGTLWATCNVGATSPEEYGDRYSWGEVNTKQSYKLTDYQYYNTVDDYDFLGWDIRETSFDVAHSKWSGDWTIPTEEELIELRDECTWTWVAVNGVNGYKVLSKVNSNYIFLPAAGCSDTSEHGDVGNYGSYWTSTCLEGDDCMASLLWFSQSRYMPPAGTNCQTANRYHGHSIRPVISKSYHNNHKFVDLGITINGQKILWATCNVGATKPEGYGDYFAWGATSQQSVYAWEITPYQTQITTNWQLTKFTKYLGSTTSTFKDDSATDSDALKTVLDPEDDAAHVNWGGSWRMPTYAELDALMNTNNCTWTWTTQNSVYGFKVTSKINGNSIFLPAAGSRYDSYHCDAGSNGCYWSSSLYSSYPYNAYYLHFYSSDDIVLSKFYRYYGQSVRPVCAFSE